jgi:3'-phosphoadenosine 5'-phosphosulfate sulfotransferase
MTAVAAQPLVEVPLALGPGGTLTEDRQIGRLVSGNSFARARASQWLRDNGDSQTAKKLERILLEGNVTKDARRDVGLVLQNLSWKHMEFGNSTQGRVARMTALASALSARNRTPMRLRF